MNDKSIKPRAHGDDFIYSYIIITRRTKFVGFFLLLFDYGQPVATAGDFIRMGHLTHKQNNQRSYYLKFFFLLFFIESFELL